MLHMASQGKGLVFLSAQVIAFTFIFSHDTTSPGFSCSYLQFEYTMGNAKEYIIFSESYFGIARNRDVNAECICMSSLPIYLKAKDFAKAYGDITTAQSYKEMAWVRSL